MVILIIAAVLITIALTAYIVLKSVQYGLRWQMETKQDIKPTMPTDQLFTHHLEKKEQKEIAQQEAITNTILQEYLNGGDPR